MQSLPSISALARACNRLAALHAVLLAVMLCAASATLRAAETQPGKAGVADLRILIDISGSMRQSDPGNLRRPALDLLLDLLPAGSRAGVWTFGRSVNLLVPHTAVNQAWRDQARSRSSQIRSIAQRSNIGEVLAQANYDRDPQRFAHTKHHRKSVILLTDGRVDIDRDAAVNQRERQRILDTLLPQYQAAGVRIHSVALSDAADTELLQTLSRDTGGIFAIANSAAELNQVFLRALDQAVVADQVPLENNSFTIDASVQEFTAVVFKQNAAGTSSLLGPSGEKFTPQQAHSGVRWRSEASYDLVTVAQPLAGTWQLDAAVDPNNRVTIVSNLQLDVNPLPAQMFIGQSRDLLVQLSNHGELLSDSRFLDLISVRAVLERDGVEVWQQALQSTAQSGSYQLRLDGANGLQSGADYELRIVADGKTFQRQRKMNFSLREPFRSELQLRDGASAFELTVVAVDPVYLSAQLPLYANIIDPQNELELVEFTSVAPGVWTYGASAQHSGSYTLTAFIHAGGAMPGQPQAAPAPVQTVAQHQFDAIAAAVTVAPAEISQAALPQADLPQADLPQTELEPAVEPEASAIGEEQAPLVEPEPSNWIVYAALAVGNLLMIGALVLVYKKVTAPSEDEIIADQASSEEEIETSGDEVEQAAELEEAEADTADVDEPLPAEELEQEPEPALGQKNIAEDDVEVTLEDDAQTQADGEIDPDDIEIALAGSSDSEAGASTEPASPKLESAPGTGSAAPGDVAEAFDQQEAAIDQAGVAIALDADAASTPDERAEIDANIDEVLAELDMAITGGEQLEDSGTTTAQAPAAPAPTGSAQQDGSKPGAAESAEESVRLELDDEFDLSSDISDELPKRSDAG